MFRSNAFRLLSYYNVLQGGKGIYEIYRKLKKIQHSSQEEIQEKVEKKLKSILEYAEKNVYYYNNLFKENQIDVGGIRGFNDLNRIPALTTRKIRDNFPERITSPAAIDRAIRGTTSGSTGEPLNFYVDRRAQPYSISSLMFYNEVMDVKPFDVHWNPKTGHSKLKQHMIFWLYGKYSYEILDINRENIRDLVRQLDTVRPSYIESYPQLLTKIGRLFIQESVWPRHKPKAIISTSEMLTERDRRFIESEFGSEVFDRYGHNEFSPAVAQECGMHDGYHINPLLTHIEIVDENDENVSEGEEGKILITDLNNRVMPFIRYDVGDLGVKGADDCPCGLNFPVLKSMEGRAADYITLQNGERISVMVITYNIHSHFSDSVYAFQLIQHTSDKLSLKVVPTDKYTKEVEDRIRDEVIQILQGFQLEIYIVEDIPPEPSGKTPFLKKINSGLT